MTTGKGSLRILWKKMRDTSMKTNQLYDKIIVVAGGAGGIGSEVSLLLAHQGATVIVAGRGKSRMASFQKKLSQIQPRNICLDTDLRSYDSWTSVFHRVITEFHRIDVLVNCVGMIVPGALEKLCKDEIADAINTNVLSTIYGMRAVIPIMKSQERGHVIVLGSLGGIVPMPFESLYSATKFAVRGFMLSMCHELKGAGIDVSLISAGPVRTMMLDLESTDEASSMSFVQNPLDPDQIADAIAKLIRHPQREIFFHKTMGKLSLLLHISSWLFGLCYPILDFVGKRKLKKYREGRMSLQHSTYSTER